MGRQVFGVPSPTRWAVTVDGGRYNFPAQSLFLQVTAHVGVVRLYFSQRAFDRDAGTPPPTGTGDPLIELSAAVAPGFEGPVQANGVWLRAVGAGAEVTVTPYAKPF